MIGCDQTTQFELMIMTFVILLAGSFNLRFNVFYNPLLGSHDGRRWRFFLRGSLYRFLGSAMLVTGITVLLPVTWGDWAGYGKLALISLAVLVNSICSYGGIAWDARGVEGFEEAPEITKKRLTPWWLMPLCVLSLFTLAALCVAALVERFS